MRICWNNRHLMHMSVGGLYIEWYIGQDGTGVCDYFYEDDTAAQIYVSVLETVVIADIDATVVEGLF